MTQLRLADPAATGSASFRGLPYLRTETGYFVEVAVTVQGGHAVANSPRIGWEEPPTVGAVGIRYQHQYSALSRQSHRAARPWALHLRRRRFAQRRQVTEATAQGHAHSESTRDHRGEVALPQAPDR